MRYFRRMKALNRLYMFNAIGLLGLTVMLIRKTHAEKDADATVIYNTQHHI